MKPSGPALVFVGRILITDSISLLSVHEKFSVLESLDSLCVSRNLSISSRLSSVLVAYTCFRNFLFL